VELWKEKNEGTSDFSPQNRLGKAGVHDGGHKQDWKNKYPSREDQYPGTAITVPTMEEGDKVALEAENLAFIMAREIIERVGCDCGY
jgi:hypothetical protein